MGNRRQDSGIRNATIFPVLLFLVLQSACKPEAYNPSNEGVDSLSGTSATDSASTVVATESPSPTASASASASPSASPSASSSTSTGYTVKINPTLTTQILGACSPVSVGFVTSSGTATTAPVSAVITLSGGSTSEFYSSSSCAGSQSTTVSFTRLDSAKSIYHRATTAGTLTISGTSSVSTVTVTSSSTITISAGSWSSANLVSSGNTLNFGTSNIEYITEDNKFLYATSKTDGSVYNMLGASVSLGSAFSLSSIESSNSPINEQLRPQIQNYSGLASILWYQQDASGTNGPTIALHDTAHGFYGGNVVGTGTLVATYISTTIVSLTNLILTYIRDSKVQISRSTDAGSTWSAVSETVASGGGTYVSAAQTVAYADGTNLAIFKEFNGTVDIKARIYSGTAWGSIATIDTAATSTFGPVIEKAPDETTLLVWVQDISGHKDLLGTFYNPVNQTFGAIAAIDELSVDVNASEGKSNLVKSDPDGNFYVIYTPNDMSNLYVKRYDKTAGTWGSQTSLITSAGSIGYYDMKSDVSGNIHVVFTQTDAGGHYHVYYKKYVKNLGWETTPVQLSMSSNNTDAISASLAVTPLGEITVVYVQPDSGGVSQGYYNYFQ